jgi:Flp pilus assembly protein TadG
MIMRSGLFKRSRQRGATLLLLMTMLPLFMIPLVGLAIDGTMLYIVQAKLASAVDGAALGAGRLLGTPANTDEIANEFLTVNFPLGWWNTRNLVPAISSSRALATTTINVAATVDVPLLFMRIFRMDHSTVAASAIATRSDTRVELVLDRSGSMNVADPVSGLNVFATMVGSAKNFIGMFTPGTDSLGLVIFDGAGVVAYPTTRPYNPDPTSAGGPDTSFATSSTAGPIFNQLNLVNSAGATGTSDALSLAFIEVQKAHNRDFVAAGSDNKLNAIVLFTDGVPTAMPVYANDPTNVSLKPKGSGAGQSNCTNNPATGVISTQMKAWMGSSGDPVSGWGNVHGLSALPSLDNSKTLSTWLSSGGGDLILPTPNAYAGCNSQISTVSPSANWTNAGTLDMAKIPSKTLYGYDTTGGGYVTSDIVNATGTHIGSVYNGTAQSLSSPTSTYQAGLAYWEAVDNTAKAIRTSNAAGNPIVVYTIAYSGNGGTDKALLKRVANTQDSSSYVATEQTGMYIEVHSADQLSAAFSAVASDLLRLAK